MTAGARNVVTAGVVLAVTIVSALRLARLIDRYAVNGFVYDHWVYTWALLKEPGRNLFASGTLRASHPTADPALLSPFPGGIPEIGGFFAQMLTWYQGLGAIVTEIVYGISRWSTRAEGFAIFGLMVAATLCALALKVRLFGPLSLWDSSIPLLFMTPHQLGIFVGVIYASYSALPILLGLLLCFCWLMPSPRLRYPALVVMHFLLTFTGQGFLLGGCVPFFLAFDALCKMRQGARGEALAAAAAGILTVGILAWWWFGQTVFLVVSPYAPFPHWPPADYVRYVAMIFGWSVGLARLQTAPALAAGLTVFVLLVTTFAVHAFRLWRQRMSFGSRSGVIVICAAFTLVFSVACTVGRVAYGTASVDSRYTSLLIPGFLAMYFAILSIATRWRRAALLAIYAAVAIVGMSRLTQAEIADLVARMEWKQGWFDCYRRFESVETCNAMKQPIFPPMIDVQLQWQLQELKRRRLSIYADGP